MARRRHRGHRMASWRRTARKVAGATVGLAGFSIAAAPLLSTVSGALQPGGSNIQNLPANIASTYGVSPTGATDLGKLTTAIIFPVLGGLIFVLGMRQIVKRI